MIGLMAGVAIPATIVGVPIWIGRQIRSKLKKNHNLTKKKRRALVGLGSTVALLLSPLVAGITGKPKIAPIFMSKIFFVDKRGIIFNTKFFNANFF